jgi:hypothetical protein
MQTPENPPPAPESTHAKRHNSLSHKEFLKPKGIEGLKGSELSKATGKFVKLNKPMHVARKARSC